MFVISANETEVAFFKKEDYGLYKANPKTAWWPQCFTLQQRSFLKDRSKVKHGTRARATMFIQRIVFKLIIIHRSAFFISILYLLCCWLWPRMFIYKVVLKTCWINKLWNLSVIVFLKVFTKLYLLRWTVSVTRKTCWNAKNKKKQKLYLHILLYPLKLYICIIGSVTFKEHNIDQNVKTVQTINTEASSEIWIPSALFCSSSWSTATDLMSLNYSWAVLGGFGLIR